MHRSMMRLAGIAAAVLIIAASPVAAADENTDPITFADAELSACVQQTAGSLESTEVQELTDLECRWKGGESGTERHVIADFSGLEKLGKVKNLSLINFDFARPNETAPEAEQAAAMFPVLPKLEKLNLESSQSLPIWITDEPALQQIYLTKGSFSEFPVLKETPRLTLVDVTGSSIAADQVVVPAGVTIAGLPVAEPANETSEPPMVEQAVVSNEPASESQSSGMNSEPSPEPQQSFNGQPLKVPAPKSVPASSPNANRATPQPDDQMPAGPLRSCMRMMGISGSDITFAKTQNLRAVRLYASCVPQGHMTDWTGFEFLPNATQVMMTELTVVEMPEQTLTGAFPKVNNLMFTSSTLDADDMSKIGNWDQLQSVSLKNNKLADFPDTITSSNLKFLTVSNPITSFPLRIDAPNLMNLTLQDTEITSFPTAGHLPSLQYLTIDGSKLSSLDVSAYPLLKELKLGSDQITSLSNVVAPQVSTLRSTNGAFTSLDATNAQLGDVTRFDCTSCKNLTSVNMPTEKMPKLQTLTLSKTAITSLENVSVPQVTVLGIYDSKLTSLAGATSFPALRNLQIFRNQIVDITMADQLPASLEVDATQQKIDYGTIPAGEPQQLSGLVKLPASVSGLAWELPWNAAANMPLLNLDKGVFTAAHEGSWQVSGSTQIGNQFDYGVDVKGQASGGTALKATIEAPDIAMEGTDYTLRAVVSGVEVTGGYQWYTKWSRPVDGATGSELAIPAITAAQQNIEYQFSVETSAGRLMSDVKTVNVQPQINDPGLRACIIDILGENYNYQSLRGLRTMDCQNRGITDVSQIFTDIGMRPWDRLNLSGNEISDISALVDNNGNPVSNYIILSDNQITDISPMATENFVKKISRYKLADTVNPKGVILDGNMISDLSNFSQLTNMSASPEIVSMSIRRQRPSLPAATVGQPITLPTVLNVAAEHAALTHDGKQLSAPTTTFTQAGLERIAWDEGIAKGVAFSGEFTIQVGSQPVVQTVPNPVVGGSAFDIDIVGFKPGEAVTVALADGASIASSTVDANGSRHLRITAPYKAGEQTLTVTGDKGTKASVALTIIEDTVVDVPDAALRSCILERLGLEEGAVTYASRLGQITGTFSCAAKGVADIKGIEALTNVAVIDLKRNSITSLAGMPTLNVRQTQGIRETILDLRANQISDLGDEMAPQPTLNQLLLGENRIADFRPLATLDNVAIKAKVQTVYMPVVLVGTSTDIPPVHNIGDGAVSLYYPKDIKPVNSKITWDKAGEYQIDFVADNDAAPHLQASGSVKYLVVDRGESRLQVAPEKLYPGQMINVMATGYQPGETVVFTLNSTPTYLGKAVADNLGIARLERVVIDRNFAPGMHEVRAEGLTDGKKLSIALEVMAPPRDVTITLPGKQQITNGLLSTKNTAGAGQRPSSGSRHPGAPRSGATGTGSDASMILGMLLIAGAAFIGRRIQRGQR